MSEIKRKKGESFESFMRRVKQQWLRSGKLIQARKVQFFIPAKSKNVRQKQTLTRKEIISKTTYLRKIGRLPPEDLNENKKRRR